MPLYALIAVLSVLPHFPPSGAKITALELEALIFCLMVLLGAQIAWAVAMSDTPGHDAEEELPVPERRA